MENMELQIIDTPKGEVKTNLGDLQKFVAQKLTEYDPKNYTGDADSAKKARAELNKSADYVKLGRKKLEEYMRNPFSDTLDGLKTIEKDIKEASKNVDIIVKDKEQEEKDEKKSLIEAYWSATQFDLYSLDKIFNQKWLNKGYKIKDIKLEMESQQGKTLSDLKIIEKPGDDVETLKALYLDSLDISETLKKADELKEKKEALKREEESRKERELQKQQNELGHEIVESDEKQESSNLASLALEEEPDTDPEMTFQCEFTGKKSALFAMRQFMTDNQITYKKL